MQWVKRMGFIIRMVLAASVLSGGEIVAQTTLEAAAPTTLEPQRKKLGWLTDFSAAQQRATKEGKLVLMYFSGSDWCRPCMKLKKKVLETDVFQAYAAEKLVLVQVDFPARKKNKLSQDQTLQNEQLAERFNPNGAFPHVVLIGPKEQMLGILSGYTEQTPEQYIRQLTGLSTKN